MKNKVLFWVGICTFLIMGGICLFTFLQKEEKKEKVYYDFYDLLLAKTEILGRQIKDCDEAIKNQQKIIDKFPGTPKSLKAQLIIANAYIQKKEYHMAIREYQKVIDNFPNSQKIPGVYAGIALCYERLKDYDQAQKAYEIIIEKYPDSTLADISRQTIKDLKDPAYIQALEALNKEFEK